MSRKSPELLPRLRPIPGLEDDIEGLMGEIRTEIEEATRKARRDDPWHTGHRCHCPRCTVIG